MLKTTAGNAVIPYAPDLPSPEISADGALFFKSALPDAGLYILKVGIDPIFGASTGKLGRRWESVASTTLGPTATGFTQPVNTNNTTIATTAFVLGQAADATSPMDGVAAVGTSFRYARQDHVHPSDTSRAPVASPAFSGTVQVGSTTDNKVNLTGAASTLAPVIEVTGTDTNIDLALTAKGTGMVAPNRLLTRVSQESKVTISANTATTTIDLSQASLFSVTVSTNTTLVFANPPNNTNGTSFTLILKNSGAGHAVSFPASVRWPGGVVPPRTTANGGRDIWTFFTEDGGTVWAGSLSIQNY